MYGSQQLTRGATFQAVDNGGDRNCHFLGLARISKFFCVIVTLPGISLRDGTYNKSGH